ncbi:OmpA family protein [Arcticibacterium luteifluviistationis]|uniref:Flagellar motor protein MotB n=1 Tax=Arcticibacterium luteifluviistationis TaxID=1784714 RepID=A0A2Z4GG55_9BACT|nr:OmpA family protein [Arcticibacterium luteifluviistationis]AWW00241.1 flagellar motor protein MotB [Arcticibacterium luteifluviistationis]
MKHILLFTLLTLYGSNALSQELQKLGSSINTEYNEIHPVISPDGESLYFVRVSHPSNNHGKNGSNDVWYTQHRSDGRWSIARKMPNTINKDKYNDLFSISPDGNTVLIRGVYKNGRKQNEVGISKCQKTKTGWTQPEKLDIPKLDAMCKGQYLSAFLTNNGKVLILGFAEKKNSKNDDLYISSLGRDGKWTKPESLGADINTGSSETTPFLASDDYTLYFASDRKGGQGGSDIWVSKRTDRTWKKWSTPINLGEKINSKEDDYYYSITATGEYAYMTTKNESIGKGDIIRFKLRDNSESEEVVGALQSSNNDIGTQTAKPKTKEEIEKEKLDALTSPNPVVMLSGKVIDTKTQRPIEARIIYETFPGGEEVGVANTNPTTGEYKIVLPYGQMYTVRAEANDFIAIGKNIDLTEVGSYKEIKGENLELAPLLAGVTVAMSNIFFEFASANLEKESFPELDRLAGVLLANKNMTIEVQGHTDNVGSPEVNLKLSQERANSVRDYLLTKSVPIEKVASVGMGMAKPIASNATTEGQAKNRRVEFIITKK